jgi:hypothetical protein
MYSMECNICKEIVGNIGKLDGFVGSCPTCGTGKFPSEIIVQYMGKSEDEKSHLFIPVGILYCAGCGTLIKDITVYCPASLINVTAEFESIKK